MFRKILFLSAFSIFNLVSCSEINFGDKIMVKGGVGAREISQKFPHRAPSTAGLISPRNNSSFNRADRTKTRKAQTFSNNTAVSINNLIDSVNLSNPMDIKPSTQPSLLSRVEAGDMEAIRKLVSLSDRKGNDIVAGFEFPPLNHYSFRGANRFKKERVPLLNPKVSVVEDINPEYPRDNISRNLSTSDFASRYQLRKSQLASGSELRKTQLPPRSSLRIKMKEQNSMNAENAGNKTLINEDSDRDKSKRPLRHNVNYVPVERIKNDEQTEKVTNLEKVPRQTAIPVKRFLTGNSSSTPKLHEVFSGGKGNSSSTNTNNSHGILLIPQNKTFFTTATPVVELDTASAAALVSNGKRENFTKNRGSMAYRGIKHFSPSFSSKPLARKNKPLIRYGYHGSTIRLKENKTDQVLNDILDSATSVIRLEEARNNKKDSKFRLKNSNSQTTKHPNPISRYNENPVTAAHPDTNIISPNYIKEDFEKYENDVNKWSSSVPKETLVPPPVTSSSKPYFSNLPSSSSRVVEDLFREDLPETYATVVWPLQRLQYEGHNKFLSFNPTDSKASKGEFSDDDFEIFSAFMKNFPDSVHDFPVQSLKDTLRSSSSKNLRNLKREDETRTSQGWKGFLHSRPEKFRTSPNYLENNNLDDPLKLRKGSNSENLYYDEFVANSEDSYATTPLTPYDNVYYGTENDIIVGHNYVYNPGETTNYSSTVAELNQFSDQQLKPTQGITSTITYKGIFQKAEEPSTKAPKGFSSYQQTPVNYPMYFSTYYPSYYQVHNPISSDYKSQRSKPKKRSRNMQRPLFQSIKNPFRFRTAREKENRPSGRYNPFELTLPRYLVPPPPHHIPDMMASAVKTVKASVPPQSIAVKPYISFHSIPEQNHFLTTSPSPTPFTSPSTYTPKPVLPSPIQPTKPSLELPVYSPLRSNSPLRSSSKTFRPSSSITNLRYKIPHRSGSYSPYHPNQPKSKSKHFKEISEVPNEKLLKVKKISNPPGHLKMTDKELMHQSSNNKYIKFKNNNLSDKVKSPIMDSPVTEGSQPLPKAIMRHKEHKVPESHRSMLRSLKYGINGEPLDVWIPITTNYENE